ncbi:MAG: NAD(P)H-dependent oxidoreductase subunit E [Candidatus Bipolaricaulota bacterium]|nr:NAD(P)H-dependent oxidoreductase subunit E [Candidatus Bipolaricaulota bacterium]
MTKAQKVITEGAGLDRFKFIDEIIKEHGKDPESLIPVLIDIQEESGYISPEVQKMTAQKLEVPTSRVHSVVSFYSYFSTEPQGDHTIGLCMGTACYAKGAGAVLEELKEELNLEEGETSEDGTFSLSVRRCLGACAMAPVMMVDDKVYGNLTPDGLPEILEEYRG